VPNVRQPSLQLSCTSHMYRCMRLGPSAPARKGQQGLTSSNADRAPQQTQIPGQSPCNAPKHHTTLLMLISTASHQGAKLWRGASSHAAHARQHSHQRQPRQTSAGGQAELDKGLHAHKHCLNKWPPFQHSAPTSSECSCTPGHHISTNVMQHVQSATCRKWCGTCQPVADCPSTTY
jgi:hypothetical protein